MPWEKKECPHLICGKSCAKVKHLIWEENYEKL